MTSENFDYIQGFVRGYPNVVPYDFKSKERNVRDYIAYMLIRTQSIFEYEGLPDSIPQRILELYLQTNGNVCIAKHEGVLYAFTGGLGGIQNEYYMPTIYTVSNPYLKFSEMFEIGKDCVVIPSDSLYIGLIPMFRKYASMLAENELSMTIVDIMARVVSLLSASDDKTKQSAEKYLQDIVSGNLGVIAESAFLDGIRAQPISSTSYNSLVPLIEYQQYIKASWLNDIGLDANFNMKREAINSSESGLNQDILLPLIDDMLKCRRIGVEAVNKMFGTNITVKLASSWEDTQLEVEASQKALEVESGTEPEVVPTETSPETEEPESENVDPVEQLEEIADQLEEIADELKQEEGGETDDTGSEEELQRVDEGAGGGSD